MINFLYLDNTFFTSEYLLSSVISLLLVKYSIIRPMPFSTKVSTYKISLAKSVQVYVTLNLVSHNIFNAFYLYKNKNKLF